MATRFYLPSSGSAPVSPAYDTNWDETDAGSRLPTYTSKQATAMTTVRDNDIGIGNTDHLFRQYVSEPLASQTISAQTVKFQIRALEGGAKNDAVTAISIRACSQDGSTIRGTILALTRDDTELDTSLVNRSFSATTSSLGINANDRLVIEIGVGGVPWGNGNHDNSISIGDDNATDLGENNTDTAAYNPWVEFANTLTFAPAGDLSVDVSDDAPVDDSAEASMPDALVVDVSDDAALDESTNALLQDPVTFEINVSDDVPVADTLSMELPDALQVNVSDDTAVADVIDVEIALPPPLSINVTEYINVADDYVSDLLAYYAFDGAAGENEPDLHGNAGDAVQTGSPPSVSGIVDTARDMDITTPSYFNIAAPHIFYTPSFTIAGFIYIHTLPNTNYQNVFQCSSGWPPPGWQLRVAFNQRLAFSVWGGISKYDLIHLITKAVGNWTFFAAVHNADKKYIAGYTDRLGSIGLEDESTYSGWDYLPPYYTTEPVLIGTNASATTARLYLDALTIFDRALSKSEIEWLYNSASGRDYSQLFVQFAKVSDLNVNVADDTTVADSANVAFESLAPLEVNVSDDTPVTDSVTAEVSDLEVDAADDIPVADSTNVALPDALKVDAADDIPVADTPQVSVGVAGELSINVSDDTAVADTINVSMPDALGVDVSDDTPITDTANASLPDALIIDVSDDTPIADTPEVSISAAGELSVNVSDDTPIADSVGITQDDLSISVSDDIPVADNANCSVVGAGDLTISRSDDIPVADAINITLSVLEINVSDNVILSENNTAVLDDLVIVVDESATIGDSVTAVVPLALAVSDSVSIADSVEADPLALSISAGDNAEAGESVVNIYTTVAGEYYISVSESVNINDAIGTTLAHLINISESITALDLLLLGFATFVNADRVYEIKAEDRVYEIDAEDRVYEIEFEDRVYSI